MHFKYTLSLLFSVLILLLGGASAQSVSQVDISKVKVSQLSDQQILEIAKKFEASGLSEAEASKMLESKGMAASEVEVYKKRLADLQAGGKTATKMPATAKKPDIKLNRDTLKIAEAKPLKKTTKIYGSDFFSNPNLKFEPNIRIATPQGYVLGPDDEVIVMLTGLNETTVNSKVTPDGNLKIPYVGLVYVNGFTIEQATAQIRNRMLKLYPALRSGQTKLSINLGNVKSIRVTILGETVQPGTYTLSSLSTLFNALYQSGGPTERGSLRHIEIIRANRVIKTVDFYTFLQKGLLDGNIRLEDQDVIRIPVYTKRVSIDGEIKRPGLYELTASETLEDLIRYAGGFSDNAYKGIAKISQTGDKERSVKDISADLFDRFILHNADEVTFGAVLDRVANRVVIQGAVNRPGSFELTPALSLKSLISKTEGLREDAFQTKGYIKRTGPYMEKEMISFDVKDILSGTKGDIPLMREDSVMIFSAQELKDQTAVTIGGYVREPGTFTYRKGMTAADAVAMAKGFTNDAASHRLEISRLVKNTSDVVSNQLLKVITLNLDSALSNTDGAFLLEPQDFLYIPRLVNYRSLGNIKVRGEVLFPGDYPQQRRDETGPEFIQRAGGITPIGSLANAQIYRNGVRVDLDLTGKNLRQDKSALILMAGDSIYVPREMPFVEVAGAVNTPQLLRYNGRSFKYYINGAGGPTETARLKGAYIQYANGINRPVRKFLFFRNYPAVTPGSKIIVPENTRPKIKIGFGDLSAITSALAALVTIVVLLKK